MSCQSIVRQEYSWGRFLVTIGVFRAMVSAYSPFSAFLDFVQAFGYRTEDDTNVRRGYRWKQPSRDGCDGGNAY